MGNASITFRALKTTDDESVGSACFRYPPARKISVVRKVVPSCSRLWEKHQVRNLNEPSGVIVGSTSTY